MTQRKRVFISYHQKDRSYKELLEKMLLGNYEVLSSQPLVIEDFREMEVRDMHNFIRKNNLKGSILTIVLIGQETFSQDFVDWEIAASLSQTHFNKRSGLMGIRLLFELKSNKTPARLQDNIRKGYARLYQWNHDWFFLEQWINRAMNARYKEFDNSRRLPLVTDVAA